MNTESPHLKYNRYIAFALLLVTFFSLTGFSPLQEAEPDSVNASITQVDTSQFPKVTVYVSVRDESGEPVGMAVSQIVLRENGQVMQPEEVSGAGEGEPVTTMLVMDVSGSMNHAGKLDSAKNAGVPDFTQLGSAEDFLYVGPIGKTLELHVLVDLVGNHDFFRVVLEEIQEIG